MTRSPSRHFASPRRAPHRISLGSLVATALLAPALPALAWNDAGHSTIDLIVYRELSPEVKAKLITILRAHPAYERDLLKDLPDGADKDEWAFIRAGVWPDMIRGRENPMNSYHRGPWHYTDVPYFPFGGEDRFDVAAPLPVKPGEPFDSVSAWEFNLKRLGDESLPLAERAVALCWVLHLGGDSHQPLHSVSLFSDLMPKGDKGGNDFLVTKDGKATNLHAVWDGGLGDDRSKITANADEMTRLHPRAQFKDALAVTDIRQWGQEGRLVCIEKVYLYGMINAAPKRPAVAAPTTVPTETRAPGPATTSLATMDGLSTPIAAAIPAATADYLANVTTVSKDRAALGAYRTADALMRTVSVMTPIPTPIPAPIPEPAPSVQP